MHLLLALVCCSSGDLERIQAKLNASAAWWSIWVVSTARNAADCAARRSPDSPIPARWRRRRKGWSAGNGPRDQKCQAASGLRFKTYRHPRLRHSRSPPPCSLAATRIVPPVLAPSLGRGPPTASRNANSPLNAAILLFFDYRKCRPKGAKVNPALSRRLTGGRRALNRVRCSSTLKGKNRPSHRDRFLDLVVDRRQCCARGALNQKLNAGSKEAIMLDRFTDSTRPLSAAPFQYPSRRHGPKLLRLP